MIKIFNFIKHPLFSGSAIMVVGSNSVSFLNYLYHLILGRMLGPAGYGELAAIISTLGLLGIIPASLNLVVIKYISITKDDSEIAALVSWMKKKTFIASLIFSLIILVASPVISSFLNINKIYYLILVAASFLFSIQTLLNRSILQGLLKFKEMVVSMLIESGVKLLAGIFLVYFGFQVGGAVVGFFISIIIGWYITKSYLRYHSRNSHKFRIDSHKILLFSIPVLIQSLAITSIYSSDVILVKHFFSSYDAGIYASLSTLGKIIFFGSGPIGAVMFPLVSQRNAEGKPFKRIFVYSFLATLLLSLFIIAVYFWVPTFAIKLLYGSAYLESANLLVWFGLFTGLFTLSALLVNYSLSLGRNRVVLLPLCAAVLQIVMILYYHQTLYTVILISTAVSALLLVSLLIYSSYGKRFNI